jgi:hypothetical protein
MDDVEPPEKPLIDVGPALGEAGHEVEFLGYEGVADNAPVLHDAGAVDERTDEDPEDRILRNIATRGVNGVT